MARLPSSECAEKPAGTKRNLIVTLKPVHPYTYRRLLSSNRENNSSIKLASFRQWVDVNVKGPFSAKRLR